MFGVEVLPIIFGTRFAQRLVMTINSPMVHGLSDRLLGTTK
jgi:hypothetical protein